MAETSEASSAGGAVVVAVATAPAEPSATAGPGESAAPAGAGRNKERRKRRGAKAPAAAATKTETDPVPAPAATVPSEATEAGETQERREIRGSRRRGVAKGNKETVEENQQVEIQGQQAAPEQERKSKGKGKNKANPPTAVAEQKENGISDSPVPKASPDLKSTAPVKSQRKQQERQQQDQSQSQRGRAKSPSVPSGSPSAPAPAKPHGRPSSHISSSSLRAPSSSVPTSSPLASSAPSLSPATNRVREVAEVPDSLFEWAVEGSPSCTDVLLSVKQRSGAQSVLIETELEPLPRKTIVVLAPNAASARIGKLMVETHLRNQLELMRMGERASTHQSNLSAFQMQVSRGLRLQFHAEKAFIGLMIGKGGARIREAESSTGCQIRVDNTGVVSISGPSPDAVEQARELMELKEVEIPMEPSSASLLRRFPQKLRELREQSECPVLSLLHDDEQGRDFLRLVGTASTLSSARVLLDITLEYVSKQQEILERDSSLRQQLNSLQYNYGEQQRFGRGGPQGRPNRGRREG
jgi:hypothetical protein